MRLKAIPACQGGCACASCYQFKMMKAKSILAVIILLVLLCTHVYGLSQDQEESVVELAHRMESVKKGSVAENRILRNIAVALNDRTALEAFLTDPSSAAYKAGLISLAQAVKIYAWIGRDDQVLMQALQSVANRLRSLLLEEP